MITELGHAFPYGHGKKKKKKTTSPRTIIYIAHKQINIAAGYDDCEISAPPRSAQ